MVADAGWLRIARIRPSVDTLGQACIARRISIRKEFQVADYLFAQDVVAWAWHAENDLVGLAYQLQFGCNVSILHFVQAPLGFCEPEYRGSLLP
jgi:hypothetical protein